MMVKQTFSLLWLNEKRTFFKIEDKTLEELNITELLSAHEHYRVKALKHLKEVPNQIEDIHYRQAILEEFIDNRALLEEIKTCVSACDEIHSRVNFAFENEATLYNLLGRIDRVNEVMQLVEKLYKVLGDRQVKAKGLTQYKKELEKGILHPLYQSFKRDVESIKAMSSGVKSLKVGINLDENLKPISAMLLSFHDKTFKSTKASKKNPVVDYNSGIDKLMQPAVQQLIVFCDQFIEGLVAMQAGLYGELSFYELGIKVYDTLKKAGFYLCQPLLFEQGKTIIDSVYNINLAYKLIKEAEQPVQNMTYNSYTAEQGGTIHILTGANRGGKTTYTQAVGQIFWLAQLGYFVPAKKAALKIVDGIYVHFPSQEAYASSHGRFGQDCKSFSDVYKLLTSNSLLLMNESFSGTSHMESLTVAFEVVKALKDIGVTAIFNTHLHELGRSIESLNKLEKIPRCVSIITGTGDLHQSFKVIEGAPLGQSYAQDIAIRYGLTFEQLVRDDRLRKAVLAATHA